MKVINRNCSQKRQQVNEKKIEHTITATKKKGLRFRKRDLQKAFSLSSRLD